MFAYAVGEQSCGAANGNRDTSTQDMARPLVSARPRPNPRKGQRGHVSSCL